eukprot:s1144_g4.t1
MNRKKLPLHLCWVNPCKGVEGEDIIHITRARWWRSSSFDTSYLSQWGRSVLKEYIKAYAAEAEEEEDEEGDAPIMKRPAARVTKVRIGRGAGPKRKPRVEAPEEEEDASKRKKKRPAEEEEEEAPEETGAGKGEEGRRKNLRAKVAALRTQLTGRAAGKPSAPILVPDDSEEESTGYSASVLAEGGLHTGEMLPPRAGLGALRDLVDPPEEKRRKVRKKKDAAGGTMTAQLLAQAEHARGLDTGEKAKKKKKIKGGGDAGKVKELVRLLRGDSGVELTKVKKEPKEKKKKKKKRKKHKKKRGGGDPSGSPDNSSSGDSSGESRGDEESSSSSSTDLRAPLQRRSAKRPGTLLRMLVDHARAVMDQSSLLATGSKEVTSGVKVSSYFNLMIRPYHASSSRDMKELHHLAVCIDELRGGTLARLGDSLASRFLAIHTAVNEGTWQSAQFLEMHPLEPAQGAPTALLLEAKRHGKMVDKSKSNDGWGRQKGGGDSWRGPAWKGDGKAQGKGNKGKEGGKGGGQGNAWGKQAQWTKAKWSQKGWRGLEDFLRVVEAGHTLAQIGCVLAWLAVNAVPGSADQPVWGAFQFVLTQGSAGMRAVHRLPKRETFPLRLGDLEELVIALACPFEDALDSRFVSMWSVHSWTYLSLLFCNSLHGCRGVPMGRWRRAEVTAVSTLRATVQRTLRLDMPVDRTAEAVENELSSRFVSYTGEEAKVHVEDGERMKVAEALVSRGNCSWVELDSVMVYRGTRVLNGLFGVGKSSTLPDGRCTLRVIMNLIPSNAVMEQLSGAVAHLPSITQYLSISLSENEELRLHQSDMTSAFYLFSMPRCWQPYMAFNLVVTGKTIRRDPQKLYALSCAVLPMGWSSAVSVMQEVSQNLLADLPPDAQVSKLKPLPPWLPGLLTQSRATRKAWWHVYLDNFFSGEKISDPDEDNEAGEFHMQAEQAWNAAGVLSSEKKKVFGAPHAQELGAMMDGTGKSLGVSAERLVKLLQSTALVLSTEKLPKKWLQVICGRWVHVLQFRRAGMAALHWVWKWIGDKRLTGAQKLKARGELFNLMTGACLFHTFLGAELSNFATASDASNTGGAVGMSQALTTQGEAFTRSGELGSSSLVAAPIIVLSLFNGIGGAFRAYDLLGLEVEALIGYDISKPANRICSRRWPHAVLGGDVRGITKQTVVEWLLKYPQAEELHLWAGFPCVDLSRVKAGRLNLEGPHSSLFKEILRVLELIWSVFGRQFKVLFFVENVSSMDTEAALEISQHFGVVPYKVQSSDAVPISRPRFCWTNSEMPLLPGVIVKDKGYYKELTAKATYPELSQWLEPGTTWAGAAHHAVLPTCMKCIRRSGPPPQPAGLDRTPQDAQMRWRSDSWAYTRLTSTKTTMCCGVSAAGV